MNIDISLHTALNMHECDWSHFSPCNSYSRGHAMTCGQVGVDVWAWMGGCGGKKVNLQITFACTLTIQNMPKERQSTAAKESACPGPEWKEELLTMAEMKLECIGRQYKSCSSWNQSNQLTAFQQWLICTYVHTSQPYEIKLNSWQEFSPIDWQTKWST